MDISDLIATSRIDDGATPGSKKRILERVSELIVVDLPNISATEVFDSLITREKLGSTGIGHGVAIPHGRVKADIRPVGAFLKLSNPVDFDAIDGKPVDLVFALLVPEQSTEEHLQILATLAEMFSSEPFCEQLRKAASADEIQKLLAGWH